MKVSSMFQRSTPSRRALVALVFVASIFTQTASWAAASPSGILASAASGTPKDVTNAIYLETLKSKTGGLFLFTDKTLEHGIFAQPLLSLLVKADSRPHSEGSSPIDFDPITNSEEPTLKSFTLTTEKEDAQKASVAAALTYDEETPPAAGEEVIVHFDFVRESGSWKIADIRGDADDIPWSLQQVLK